MKLPRFIYVIFAFSLVVCLISCGASEHTHTFGEWTTTKAPTCEAAGEQERVCDCSEKQTAPIPTVAHSYEDGICTMCGESESLPGEEHTHAFGVWSMLKTPTCTAEGERMRECACGERETETVPTAAHAYENGLCVDCGDLNEEAHTHTFGAWSTSKTPTCTAEGERMRECACGERESERVAVTSHNEENGICKVCGNVSTNHKHAYVSETVKEATCQATGTATHTCACGDTTASTTLPVVDHRYVDGACEWCGKAELHLHSYGSWVTSTEASCRATGLQIRTCSCGDTQTKTLDIIDHIYVDGICSMCKQQDPDAFVPDTDAGQENTVGNIYGTSYGTYYATQGEWLYFAKDVMQITKYNRSTGETVSLYKPSYGYVRCINVVGDWIYFFVEDEAVADCYMAKVRTDGSSFQKLLTSVRIEELLVVKDAIFYTTIKNPYTNYTTDCAPLYRMTVNGEGIQMIHNGYVSSMVSDGTYVYFRYTPKNSKSSIYRIKYDGTNPVSLYTEADVNYIFLADAKLYFLKYNEENDESTVGSISIKGGSYTTYGKIPYYTDALYVYGSCIYYHGSPYVSGGFSEEYGLIEYNTATGTYKLLRQCDYFTVAPGALIVENYNDDYMVTSISVYNVQSKSWRGISLK